SPLRRRTNALAAGRRFRGGNGLVARLLARTAPGRLARHIPEVFPFTPPATWLYSRHRVPDPPRRLPPGSDRRREQRRHLLHYEYGARRDRWAEARLPG